VSLSAQVAHAFNRFGLGGRPDDAIPTDVMTWLTDQLSTSDPLANGAPNIVTCLGWASAVFNAKGLKAQKAARAALQEHFEAEQQALLENAVTTPTPFWERLVNFWANHFAILTGEVQTLATAGCFVREAIRPYITDTFENMLLAVMQHPAMIFSLDNQNSIGPQSPQAIEQGSGNINENLARETLELFTVTNAANFTQADVDALAYVLTGWTVSLANPAGFIINPAAHQPGPQTVLGYTTSGNSGDGYEILEFLGTHPLSYANIAYKLVAHFTTDVPDPNDVQTVTNALSANGGSLLAATNAVINLSNAWVPLTKLRRPFDYVVAASRAVEAPIAVNKATNDYLTDLGMPIWGSPFPNGWQDVGLGWASPSQMMLRTNWSNKFANHFKTTNFATTENIALGGLIAPQTLQVLAQLKSNHDKTTVLFCCPEFQRR
jgi:uncharacterized protein (DUF1800 family)